MMKYYVLLLLVAFTASCNLADEKTEDINKPIFDPNGKSFIKLINEDDTAVNIALMYPPLMSRPMADQWSASVQPATDTLFTVDVGIRQNYIINLHNFLVELFMVPDDTTTIVVSRVIRTLGDPRFKFFSTQKPYAEYSFEGKYAKENRYLREKRERFREVNRAQLANDPALTLADYAHKIDSLSWLFDQFLDSANRASQMDLDFYNLEKAENYYSTLESKIKQPSFSSFQFGQVPDLPEDYYNFIEEVDLDSTGSEYSSSYYYFLSTLAFHKTLETWSSKIPDLENQIRQKQDSLIYQYLSDSYSNNDFDPFKKDSLIESAKHKAFIDQFVVYEDSLSPEIMNLLIYQQASLDAQYLKGQKGHISSILYKTEFPDNPYLDMIEYDQGLKKGQPAPYFYLQNINGGFTELADFKEKLVYINFWAPWCKPCMAELPYEKKLAAKIEDYPVEIVNICTQCNEKSWRSTVQEKQMPGVHLFAQGEWPEKLRDGYQTFGIPHYTLISSEGRVIANPTYRPSAPQIVDFIKSQLPGSELLK